MKTGTRSIVSLSTVSGKLIRRPLPGTCEICGGSDAECLCAATI